MSQFKVEVIADRTDKWVGNLVTHDTFDKASEAAKDLAYRWMMVKKARVVEFDGDNAIKTTEVFS